MGDNNRDKLIDDLNYILKENFEYVPIYKEQSVIDYNERMKNESEKHSEYMEMESMYKDGLLER